MPTAEDEALRDLVRARKDAVAERLRARHHLSKFLLRRKVYPPPGVRPWSAAHRQWLDALVWTGPSAVVFRKYLHTLDEIMMRIQRLEQAMTDAAVTSPRAPMIQALQALRGVTLVTARHRRVGGGLLRPLSARRAGDGVRGARAPRGVQWGPPVARWDHQDRQRPSPPGGGERIGTQRR